MFLRVRLTRKLADYLNGIDLSHRRVGECIDLPAPEARMLILEGWAELAESGQVQESKQD